MRWSARTFQHLNDLMGGYDLMGIDVSYNSTNSPLAAVKHIDRAVALCISQWLSPEGMPKHQTLGLSDGYTGVEVTTGNSLFYDVLTYNLSADVLTDELRTKIHEEAVKKEVEYEN